MGKVFYFVTQKRRPEIFRENADVSMGRFQQLSLQGTEGEDSEQLAGAGVQHFDSNSACPKSLWARSAAAPRAAARALRLVAATGAPRVLTTATTTATGALGSAAVGPAAPAVAQAAAPTPRAAAAPGAGATAGGDWGRTWRWALGGTFGRRKLGGGALGRELALLLALLAGHLAEEVSTPREKCKKPSAHK